MVAKFFLLFSSIPLVCCYFVSANREENLCAGLRLTENVENLIAAIDLRNIRSSILNLVLYIIFISLLLSHTLKIACFHHQKNWIARTFEYRIG